MLSYTSAFTKNYSPRFSNIRNCSEFFFPRWWIIDGTQMYATEYFGDNNYFEMMKHFCNRTKWGRTTIHTDVHLGEHIFTVIPISIITIEAVNMFYARHIVIVNFCGKQTAREKKNRNWNLLLILNYGLQINNSICRPSQLFTVKSHFSLSLSQLIETLFAVHWAHTGMRSYVQFQCRVTLIVTAGRHFIRILFFVFGISFRIDFMGPKNECVTKQMSA